MDFPSFKNVFSLGSSINILKSETYIKIISRQVRSFPFMLQKHIKIINY